MIVAGYVLVSGAADAISNPLRNSIDVRKIEYNQEWVASS
jgi:hypothetical protein